MSNSQKFRFSDRISFVTEHGESVFINDRALAAQAAKTEELNVKALQEQSFQQGWAACETEKNKEIDKLLLNLEAWKKELPESLNSYFSELEKQIKGEVIDLAFKLAEQIIGCEVEKKTTYQTVLNDLLDQTVSTSQVQLYVNPEVAKLIKNGEVGVRSGVSVIADPGLRVGEAKLIGGNGIIDGTFNARLSALQEHIRKSFNPHADAAEEQGE